MLIMEWWQKRDDYIKERFINNCEQNKEKILAEKSGQAKKIIEIVKQSIKEAEEQLAADYPDIWSAWLKKRDCRVMDSLACKILGKIGINVKKARPANIKNVVTAATKVEFPFISINKNKIAKFTWQELMLHRQCFILGALGIIDYKMVLQ